MPKVGFFVQNNKVNKHGFANIKAVVSVTTIDETPDETKYITRQAAKKVGAIKPKHWHKKNQRVAKNRADEEYNNSKEINKHLEAFEQKTNGFIQACIDNGTDITVELIRDHFDGKLTKKAKSKPAAKPITLWEAYDKYLEYIKINKEASTVKNHTTTRNYFKEFEANTGTMVSFNNITTAFGRDFEYYVLKEKQQHYNYLSTLLRRFKTFLNWCIEGGYYSGKIPKNFKVPEQHGTVVTLSVDEFNQLYRHEFKSERLGRVRDIFCFGCLTGLRIGDLKRLNRDNIQSGFIVTYMQKVKRDTALQIPILPQAQKIIDKYQEQYFLLPQISEQKFNSYIKEAAKEAGITAQVALMSFKTSKGVVTMATKDEVIHAHMTRKTFATLAYKAGIDVEMIKKITGIKQEKTLIRYLNIDTDTLAEKMKAFDNLIGD